MEELAKLEEERGNLERIASNEMCTFLILNISSLQLIPCEYDCLSEPVRERESGGNCGTGNCGDIYQYADSDCVL